MPIGTNNAVIPGCGVHHIALQTRDWDASLRLYRDVLGMPVVAEFGTPERPVLLLDIGDGAHMELFGPTAEAATAVSTVDAAFPHLALTTTDTRKATEHVRAAGYEITVEPKEVQLGALHVVLAFFKGPNGEVIEFFQTQPGTDLGAKL